MAKGKRGPSKAKKGGDVRNRIHAALTATPGRKTADLGPEMGLDPELVRIELVKMEKEGQARREGRTRGTTWFVTGEAPAPVEASGDEAAAQAPNAKRTRKRKAAPSAAPAEPKAPRQARASKASSGGTIYGWKATILVKGAEIERIVVAANLAAAAEIASSGAAAMGGEALHVSRLGAAFAG
jgi:hypothetical protein